MQHTGVEIDRRTNDVSILIRPEGRMQLLIDLESQSLYLVSILIRPEGRMQQQHDLALTDHNAVSILIRPEGRMQRGLAG